MEQRAWPGAGEVGSPSSGGVPQFTVHESHRAESLLSLSPACRQPRGHRTLFLSLARLIWSLCSVWGLHVPPGWMVLFLRLLEPLVFVTWFLIWHP